MIDMKKILLLIAGSLLLALGAIGIFLPLLPTTPLVIASAVCFSYSSEKAYSMLLKNKYFGAYIENFKTKQGVPLGVKIRGIVMLWALLLLSAALLRDFSISLILGIVGTAVTIHLGMLKTRKDS